MAGVIMALGGVVMTRLAVNSGLNPFLAIGLGLLATTFVGWINGLLITRGGLPPFIATLGMQTLVYGACLIYTGAIPIGGLRNDYTGLATGYAGLDELLSGLQPSTLNIVGARPAMGKTSFALNLTANAAFQSRRTRKYRTNPPGVSTRVS